MSWRRPTQLRRAASMHARIRQHLGVRPGVRQCRRADVIPANPRADRPIYGYRMRMPPRYPEPRPRAHPVYSHQWYSYAQLWFGRLGIPEPPLFGDCLRFNKSRAPADWVPLLRSRYTANYGTWVRDLTGQY